MVELGRSEEQRHNVRLFLFVVVGQSTHFWISLLLIVMQVFCSSCALTKWWYHSLWHCWRIVLYRNIHQIYWRLAWPNATISRAQFCDHYGQLSDPQTSWHSRPDWFEVTTTLSLWCLKLMYCKFIGGCAASSYRPTHPITIRSSLHSQQWSTTFVGMVTTLGWQWHRWLMKIFISRCSMPWVPSLRRMHLVGLLTVDMYDWE